MGPHEIAGIGIICAIGLWVWFYYREKRAVYAACIQRLTDDPELAVMTTEQDAYFVHGWMDEAFRPFYPRACPDLSLRGAYTLGGLCQKGRAPMVPAGSTDEHLYDIAKHTILLHLGKAKS